jgi:N-acetylglucosamine-6-phosphate deacetylase
MSKTAYIAERIFTGEKFIGGHAVIVDGGIVENVIPTGTLPSDINTRQLPHQTLAPAFMDLQIYGGDEGMFSLFPSVESLQATHRYCVRGGATHFMATVATNDPEITYQAISAAREYWAQGLPGLLGLHLEGPYLNAEKKGAHLTRYIKRPVLQEVKDLLSVGEGMIRMMTVAPECCDDEVIRYLMEHGVVVSAGHSNATYDQAMDAFHLGIPTATHLYNAMSPLQHRAPGMVGAIFDGDVFCSIVADGIHVDFAAVRIAKKIMGNRLFLITDAVTEAQTDSYTYIMENNRYVTENGTLAGSCLTMGRAVKNLIIEMGIDPAEALPMASLYPARVIGRDNSLGRIAPGYEVDWVVLDQEYDVQGTITGEVK